MNKIRVLKLGGSLLNRSDWPSSLKTWLQAEPNALNLLIVGGGELVEAVRELDRAHELNPEFTHWLCIDLLAATLKVANQLIPEFPLISSSDDLEAIIASGRTSGPPSTYMVAIAAFYSLHTSTQRLPEDWNTTSDSLAAWLALQVDADELVLFKSVAAPAGVTSVIELANLGLVDKALPAIADSIKSMRIVNLSAS